MTTQNMSEFFIGRQSILDREQNLAGFELLFRSNQKNSAQFLDNVTATCSVINHAFNELGFQTVLGKHRGFINVNDVMLMDDMLELLPKDQVVIELLETIEINEIVVERCKYLKSRGYLLALDDIERYTSNLDPLRGQIDFIKIDLKLSGIAKISDTLAHFKNWHVNILAEKVDNPEEAQLCLDAGFHLFQGYYFAKPLIITGKRLTHSEIALMQLLDMVMSDADTEAIEKIFKQNPGLCFNLLRLTNSAAAGSQHKITSLSNAIMVLGRRQLQRWLQLLIYTNDGKANFPDPLLQLAATRGKSMELLVQNFAGCTKELEDQAFMVGIMSLMNTLLSMPLAEIISPLNPPAEIRDALLSRQGLLGNLLSLIEHLENFDMNAAGELLDALSPLSVEQINRAQLEALAWSNSFGESNA
jgi:c-di-GMP-related signal transduction protein